MSDIRSFFGGKPGAAPSKKVEAEAPAKREVAPAPEAARKRLRRVVDEDEDGAGESSAAPTPPVPASQPAPTPAASEAPAKAVVPSPKAAPEPPSTPKCERTPAAAALLAASGGASSAAAAGGDESDAEPGSPSPLEGKLQQAEGKAKSKGTLDNMRLTYDNARAFKRESTGALWKDGEPVPYSFLCAAFDRCSQTTKRLEITNIMTNTLRAVLEATPADLLPTLYLSLNVLGPAFAGIELGLGDALLLKAVAETCGRQEKQLKAELENEGDLGSIAMAARATQRLMFAPAKLTVRKVFATFNEIARLSGKDCQLKKRDKVKGLLVAAVDSEAMYLVRSLQGKLRVGLAEQTVLTALAHALTLSPPATAGIAPPAIKALGVEGTHALLSKADLVRTRRYKWRPASARGACSVALPAALRHSDTRRCGTRARVAGRSARAPSHTLPPPPAPVPPSPCRTQVLKDVYSQLPSYDIILREALLHPLAQLAQHVHLTAGVPVRPMLAKPTKGIAEVLERFGSGTFTCEYKYDGERAQIHLLEDGTYKIFSRNSEDMTGKYPDVLERLPNALLASTKSFIIDCEAVAYDVEKGKLLPFQQLSTRAKKNVTTDQVKVQVKVFAFDCIFLNGTPLLKRPLAERRAALHGAFRVVDGEFAFATASDSDNAEEIADFLNDAVAASCEGLMVKTLDKDATYEPSKRSLNWLKVKKDYLEGMGDSLDLVPIGAYHGRGKRTGVYGAYLLACYDPEREEYQSICKIGTGFSEEALAALAAFFKEEGRTLSAPRPYYRYPSKPDLVPDVWFDACTVRARRSRRERAGQGGSAGDGARLWAARARYWPALAGALMHARGEASSPLATASSACAHPHSPPKRRPPPRLTPLRPCRASGVGGAGSRPVDLAAALRRRR